MRFALVNNERVEAQPKLKGLCPGCSQPVIAKCGTRRINHWAHIPDRPCGDKWWESEKEWHREWKNKFPSEFQEYRQQDLSSGEWHIADVRTEHDLVIEFQHSHLDPQERIARERFYKNMIWVVDGTRRKRDYTRFHKAKDNLRPIARGHFLVYFPDECFPADWLESSVPVIFDFQGIAPPDPQDMIRNTLWCLLPGRAEGRAVVVGMSRKDFVTIAPTRSVLIDGHRIITELAKLLQQERHNAEIAAHRQFLQPRRMSGRDMTQRRRWRF